jgi:hypothetical protein
MFIKQGVVLSNSSAMTSAYPLRHSLRCRSETVMCSNANASHNPFPDKTTFMRYQCRSILKDSVCPIPFNFCIHYVSR